MVLDPATEVPSHIALGLCILMLEPETWIYRRVEQVSYLDHNTVRRRMTVDLQVPPSPAVDESMQYLPVALFAKHKLVNFDLRDAAGASVPMLTAEQNGHLSTALLTALAKLDGDDRIDSIVEQYIPVLVHATSDAERALAWSRIFQAKTTVGTYLLTRHLFVAVATELRTNFILYLPVPPDDAGKRKIIKIAFDAPRPAVDRSGLRVRLGWRGAEDSFRVPLAGYCASCHFELEAPAEMEITDGRFAGRRGDEVATDTLSAPTRRAHFNLARLDRGGGQVAVRLKARSSMLGGAALLSAMNAAAICFVFLRAHELVVNNGGASIVPALIAIPGILIGYVTRPSEHAMVTSFLSDLRAVALVSGITSFLAAFAFVAGFPEPTLKAVLLVLTAIALGAWFALTVSWYAARPRQHVDHPAW